jgi:hypothetical protein
MSNLTLDYDKLHISEFIFEHFPERSPERKWLNAHPHFKSYNYDCPYCDEERNVCIMSYNWVGREPSNEINPLALYCYNCDKMGLWRTVKDGIEGVIDFEAIIHDWRLDQNVSDATAKIEQDVGWEDRIAQHLYWIPIVLFKEGRLDLFTKTLTEENGDGWVVNI